MSWFDFLRANAVEPSPTAERRSIPLFPLSVVLCPGGRLALKVFEQRYLDMAAECMRQGVPFGVCLIASGKEVGEVAVPHAIGTLADIASADMEQLGILLLTVRGGQRFRIVRQHEQPDGLLRAEIECLVEPPACTVPDAQQAVIPLLRRIADDLGPERLPTPHVFDDAVWVGYRLTEIVPVQPLAKQKLLELDDPLVRLEILHTYLAQRKLL